MSFRLKPFGDGEKNLKTIVMNNNNNNITLGRNGVTGLDVECKYGMHVSRSHVEIKIQNEKLYMNVICREEKLVHLNGVFAPRGHQEVKVGDKISLLGRLNWFNYIVEKVEEEILPALSRSNTTSSNHVVQSLIDDEEPTTKKRKVEVFDLVGSPPHKSINSNTSNFNVVNLIGGDQPVAVDLSSSVTSSSSNKSNSIDLLSSSSSSSVPTSSSLSSANVATTTAIATNNTNAAAVAAAQTSTEKITKEKAMLISNLLRQYECGICFETMAAACSLNPCGDNYCFACISDWTAASHTNCPSCQETFDLNTSLPNRTQDNAVREILKEDKESLQLWEERVTTGVNQRKEFLEKKKNEAAAAASIADAGKKGWQHDVPELLRFMNNNQPPVTSHGRQATAFLVPPTNTTRTNHAASTGNKSGFGTSQPVSVNSSNSNSSSNPINSIPVSFRTFIQQAITTTIPTPTTTSTITPNRINPFYQAPSNTAVEVVYRNRLVTIPKEFRSLFVIRPTVFFLLIRRSLHLQQQSQFCTVCSLMIEEEYTLGQPVSYNPTQSNLTTMQLTMGLNFYYHLYCVGRYNRYCRMNYLIDRVISDRDIRDLDDPSIDKASITRLKAIIDNK